MSEAALRDAITRGVRNARSILDVGAGRAPFRELYPEQAFVCSLDAFAPDLFASPLGRDEARVLGLAERMLPRFADGAFDVVLGLDFIEHFEIEPARLIALEMARVARLRACLFVPEGEHPQEGTPQNPLQAHRSTWRPGYLEALGYRVTRWPAFHNVPGKDPGAMWAVLEK